MAFGQSQHLGTMDAFLEDFFLAWLEHFKEMEYLTAGSDVQVFIKRRMIKVCSPLHVHIRFSLPSRF